MSSLQKTAQEITPSAVTKPITTRTTVLPFTVQQYHQRYLQVQLAKYFNPNTLEP